MSTSLIQLLKYNLTSSTRATTLREELESVRNYITIQKFRYSDSFDFSIRADEDALDCEVVRFILQPLVENSILHGFEDSSERYSICISAFFSEEQLHIKVIDNGAGMNRDQMREINDAQWNRYRFNRIGVANIRKRIKLYFGDTYDVRYDSVPNVGTIAEIVLPIRRRGQSCAPEQPLS
jgi:two-component system sensor histidine kinase YesM